MSAAGAPEANARDLWNPLHLHHRAEDWITERHVFDRVFVRRHGPRELARPLIPGRLSPEVVDPEEPALLEIEPQSRGFFRREPDGTDVRGHQVCAVEEGGVSQPDEPHMGNAFLLPADPRLRQL